ncbi:MAG TPA: hypothetical protein VNC78_09805 [Actinomycetota bacterium]|nr:hypothetical protein [Actinomycetota bacterium]
MEGGARRTRRRRSKRGRSGGERVSTSPVSSEDLVRALPKERPETLTAPADGQLLEEVIGDLQSSFGVPQYPQEYRITIKVADRDGRPDRGVAPEEPAGAVPPGDEAASAATPEDGPRREKAPAAPRMGGASAANEAARPGAPRKRKRSRRRRGRGGAPGTGGGPPAS